jgi:hypothetical protein
MAPVPVSTPSKQAQPMDKSAFDVDENPIN